MTTIYNKFTKKRVYNVRWAPKGKFWYVKGRSTKYYPSKGWQNTSENPPDGGPLFKRRFAKAAIGDQGRMVGIADTGGTKGVISEKDAGKSLDKKERDGRAWKTIQHLDSDVPLSFFYKQYKFEKDLWDYYQECIRSCRKIMVLVKSIPQYEFITLYPFGHGRPGYSTNGTSWVPTSLRGPAVNIYDPATLLKEAEYIEVKDIIEFVAYLESLYKYYLDDTQRCAYGYVNHPTIYDSQLWLMPSGTVWTPQEIQKTFFERNRHWIIKAFKENMVSPEVNITGELSSYSNESLDTTDVDFFPEIPGIYTGYVDGVGVFAPSGLQINDGYTQLFMNFVIGDVYDNRNIGPSMREYVVCDIVYRVDEFTLWAQEQDLFNFFGFSFGSITSEILDSIKVVIPRVRSFGNQVRQVPDLHRLISEYKQTRAYDILMAYTDNAILDVNFVTGHVTVDPRYSDPIDISGNLLTGGLYELIRSAIYGIGHSAQTSGDNPNLPSVATSFMSGTTPIVIVPMSTDMYQFFIGRLRRGGVLDGENRPTGRVSGYGVDIPNA